MSTTVKLHCHPNHPDMRLSFEEREDKLNQQMGSYLNKMDAFSKGRTDRDNGNLPGARAMDFAWGCLDPNTRGNKKEYWYYTVCVNHEERCCIEEMLQHHAWYHVHSNGFTPHHSDLLQVKQRTTTTGLIDSDKYFVHGVFCLKKNRSPQQVSLMFRGFRPQYAMFECHAIRLVSQLICYVKHCGCYHEVGTNPVVCEISW